MPAPLKGLALYLAVVIGLAVGAVIAICRAFGLDHLVPLLHIPVVFGLLLASLAPAAVLLAFPRVRASRLTHRLTGLLPGLVVAGLLALYAADFANNRMVGSHLTHKVVQLWIEDWWTGGNLLSLSPVVVVAGIAAFLLVVVGHLAIGPWLARHLVPLMSSRRSAAGVLVTLLVVFSGYGLWARDLRWRAPRSEFLSSDPVIAFMRSSVDVYDDLYFAEAARLREEEPRVRAAYPRTIPFTRRNVIVIIVDSLRADHMAVYGYPRRTTPFLDRMVSDGQMHKVDMATSTCSESNCGILSTLYSKHLRRQIPEAYKLHEVLRDQGYPSYFLLSGNHDWHGLTEMYGKEHTVFFDGRNATQHQRSDDRVLFEGLEQVPNQGPPAFFYFHLMSSHLIGVKQEAFRIYHPSDVENDWDSLFAGDYDRPTVVNNYDNGVSQADAIIEELFAALDNKGYLRDSLVVITSDHGEGLGDSPRIGYGHITTLYQPLINIPLLVYDPLPGATYHLDYGTQLDIAPTILDRLGLPAPATWEGQSLLTAERRVSVHQTTLKSPTYAVVLRTPLATYKYIRSFVGRIDEVYNLTDDPDERINIRDTVDPALLSMMQAELAAFRSR